MQDVLLQEGPLRRRWKEAGQSQREPFTQICFQDQIHKPNLQVISFASGIIAANEHRAPRYSTEGMASVGSRYVIHLPKLIEKIVLLILLYFDTA